MMRTLIVAGAVLAALATRADAAGDPTRGMEVYERCQACHSPDANRVGPRHRGVVGRKAGSLPDFPYATALISAGFVWDEALLDRWLTDPQALVPGQRMGYRLGEAQDRADVIAYLKTLRVE
jgi:cytochrome c